MSDEQLAALFRHRALCDDSFRADSVVAHAGSMSGQSAGMTSASTASAGNSDGGGHGFGLLNCKGIIEKYRKISSFFAVCDIGATSSKGKGSRFFFRLPKGVARVIAALVVTLLATVPRASAAAHRDVNRPSWAVSAFADSAYFCNVRGDYALTLAYADSCMAALNDYVAAHYPSQRRRMTLGGDYPAAAAELAWLHDSVDIDYSIVLDVRNETAVAALALHRWALYSYNNSVYTQLFRERSADASLPDYVSAMQRAEGNRSVAIVMLVVLFVMIFPLYYLLYYRHRLYYHMCVSRLKSIADMLDDDSLDAGDMLKRIDGLWPYSSADRKPKHGMKHAGNTKTAPPEELTALVGETRRSLDEYRQKTKSLDAKEELAADELRLVCADRDRLYVSNNVLDNCLSSLKHETMYYPSRLSQLIARDGGGSGEVGEMAEYYRLIYSTLLAHASTTLESVRRLIRPQDSMRLLMDILRRKNGGHRPRVDTKAADGGYVVLDVAMDGMPLAAGDAKTLFTPATRDVDFLVCCQILRDIGETTGARACGIAARTGDDGRTALITIKTTEKIWKNSQS